MPLRLVSPHALRCQEPTTWLAAIPALSCSRNLLPPTLSSIAQVIEALELTMGQYYPADLYIAESLFNWRGSSRWGHRSCGWNMQFQWMSMASAAEKQICGLGLY